MESVSWFEDGFTTSMPMDSAEKPYVAILKQTNTIVLTVIMTFIMVAMGCVVTVEDFKVALRRPIGVLIGFACQFVILPLSAFCLGQILQLTPAIAIGMLITASSPGGVTSNLYTFWVNGDVCLSITMTTISTAAAVFMMPFNLWLYSRSWTNKKAVVPYKSIITALVLVLIPVALGMLVRWKKPRWAAIITKIGSFLGLFAIVINIILNGVINPKMFTSAWNVWIAAIILPFLGYGLGYLFAVLFRQTTNQCRAIAFETGAQNVAIALSLVAITFDGSEIFVDVFIYPSFYGPTLIMEALILVVAFRMYDRKCGGTGDADGYQPTNKEEQQQNTEEQNGNNEIDKGKSQAKEA